MRTRDSPWKSRGRVIRPPGGRQVKPCLAPKRGIGSTTRVASHMFGQLLTLEAPRDTHFGNSPTKRTYNISTNNRINSDILEHG